MTRKIASAKDILEIVKSDKDRLTYALHRAALKTILDPQHDAFRHLLPETVNIIKETKLLDKLDSVAHSLDKDATLGRKKQKDDQKRTKESTKTIQEKRQDLMKATWSEAKDILKSNKGLVGKPYSIAGNIIKRIEENRIKNKLISQEKRTQRTLARYIQTSPKPF